MLACDTNILFPAIEASHPQHAAARRQANGGRVAEAEGECREAEVVVDRLGYADHRDAVLVELLGDGERSVAPRADQP
jgi:hypothetical protein